MRRFRKKSVFHMIILPEHGRVMDDRVFEGEKYARYCPHLLDELPPAPKVVKPPEPPVAKDLPEQDQDPEVVEPIEPRQGAATLPPQKIVNATILADTTQKLATSRAVDDALDQAEATVAEQRRRGRPKKAR